MSLIARIKAGLDAARKERNDPDKVKLLSALSGEAERVGKDSSNRATSAAETVAATRKFVKNAEVATAELGEARRGRSDSVTESYLRLESATDVPRQSVSFWRTVGGGWGARAGLGLNAFADTVEAAVAAAVQSAILEEAARRKERAMTGNGTR